MKLIPLLLFISVIATSAKAETSYEAINCSWAGSIIILTVPMDTSWNFQKMEEEAEKICESFHEYEDTLNPECFDTEEE